MRHILFALLLLRKETTPPPRPKKPPVEDMDPKGPRPGDKRAPFQPEQLPVDKWNRYKWPKTK